MTDRRRRITVAPQKETQRREREVQLLVNVIQPDPEYQPFLLRDEASALDVSPAAASVIRGRLEFYSGEPLGASLGIPLWQLVDLIKARRPDWPEE